MSSSGLRINDSDDFKQGVHDGLWPECHRPLPHLHPEHEHDWTASTRPGPFPNLPAATCADPNCPER